MGSHTPDKSGRPSTARGAGAATSTSPLAVRGMLPAGTSSHHCASAAPLTTMAAAAATSARNDGGIGTSPFGSATRVITLGLGRAACQNRGVRPALSRRQRRTPVLHGIGRQTPRDERRRDQHEHADDDDRSDGLRRRARPTPCRCPTPVSIAEFSKKLCNATARPLPIVRWPMSLQRRVDRHEEHAAANADRDEHGARRPCVARRG